MASGFKFSNFLYCML